MMRHSRATSMPPPPPTPPIYKGRINEHAFRQPCGKICTCVCVCARTNFVIKIRANEHTKFCTRVCIWLVVEGESATIEVVEIEKFWGWKVFEHICEVWLCVCVCK